VAKEHDNLLNFHFMLEVAESNSSILVWCKDHAVQKVAMISHFIEYHGCQQVVYLFEEFVWEPGSREWIC